MNLNDRRKEISSVGKPTENWQNTSTDWKTLLQEKSLANSQLQAALQQATEQIRTADLENSNLLKKLQEKSENEVKAEKKIAQLEEQIAKRNESDLLWQKSQEKEKQNNKQSKILNQREKELEEQQRKLEQEKLILVAESDSITARAEKLDSREKTFQQREKEQESCIRQRAEELIARKEQVMEAEYQDKCGKVYQLYKDMDEDRQLRYRNMKLGYESLVGGSFVYCVLLFLYEMMDSVAWKTDVISAGKGFIHLLLTVGDFLIRAGKYAGSVAYIIPHEMVAGILYYVILVLLVVAMAGLIGWLLYRGGRYIIEEFVWHMGDKLSLGVAIYLLTTIVFFADTIRRYCTWNLLGMFAAGYGLYILIRALVKMKNEKLRLWIFKIIIGVTGVVGVVGLFAVLIKK